MTRTYSAIVLLLIASSLVACGDDDEAPATDSGVRVDANREDLGAADLGNVDLGSVDLGGAVVDAGNTDAGPPGALHCGGSALIIAAVDPGSWITLFNPTAAPIALTGYQLCQQPSYVAITGSVPANGSLDVPWPATFADTNAGGEVALYSSGSFASAAAQVDFVCWGTGHSPSRKSVAEMDGDWTGPCAGAITGTSIDRVPGSDGSGAASYDPAGAAVDLACP